jgi:hypothetical protein
VERAALIRTRIDPWFGLMIVPLVPVESYSEICDRGAVGSLEILLPLARSRLRHTI